MKISNRGFSLIEITISVAILGFITLLSMTLMKNQQGQDAILRYKHDLSMKILEVKRILSKPERCEELLGGKTVGSAVSLQYSSASGSGMILAPGEYPTFIVKTISLETSALPTGFDLVITVKPKASGVVSSYFSDPSREEIERIGIVGTVGSGNIVTSCGPVVSDTNVMAMETICGSLSNGATWDNTNKRCSLNIANFNCATPGQIPIRMTRFGQFTCGDIARYVDFDKVFDFTPATCPAKNYSFHLAADGRIGVGCLPNPADRLGPRPLINPVP